MLTTWDLTVARKMHADVPVRDVGESAVNFDTEMDEKIDELAERLVGQGADRRAAQLAAELAIKAVCTMNIGSQVIIEQGMQLFAGALPADAADKLCHALSRAWEARDAKLAIGCLFFAMDRPPHGAWSMRQLANSRGVSVEAVSNEVQHFQEILGLPRTKQQKSNAALAVYATTNGAQ